MKKKITIVLTLLAFNYIELLGQNETKAASFNMEGQIAITTNGKAGFLNIGGPAIKFSFSKFAITINMLPSLKYEIDSPRPEITPLLGVGPQLYFLNKRFILSFPCYYNTVNFKSKWTITGGLGYVFTKPKK